jgi:hypothetical protein
MPPSSHPLPPAQNVPSLPAMGVLLMIAVGILFLGAVGFAHSGTLEWLLMTSFYAAGPLIGAIHTGVQRWRWVKKRDEWALRMKALGLEFQQHVTTGDITPNRRLPLFSFGDPARQRADFLARGVVERREIVVMNYRYADWFRTPNGPRFLRSGIQTIALFPHVEDLPVFHLAPAENEWDTFAPHWVEELNVGRAVRFVDDCGDDPVLIRTEDELDVLRLFSKERIKRLGNLTGWTIESRDSRVVIYRHGEVMDTDELPYFVYRALDMVAVLTDFEETAARPTVGRDERVIPEAPRKWMDRLQRPRRG